MSNNLQPHQQRVVDERTKRSEVKTGIADDLGRLKTFIAGNAVFEKLDQKEKERLREQAQVMEDLISLFDDYLDVLDQRIAAFEASEPIPA